MRNIIIVIVALSLNACTLWRNFETPENEVKDIAGDSVRLTTDTLTMSWGEMFPDESLQILIKKALTSNTDLRTAKLSIDQAEAALLSSKLSYVPSFNLHPEGGLSHVLESSTNYTYNIPISAQWEIDVWGRMRNQMRQAKSSLMQSEEYVKLVETQLISGVANLYYTLVFLNQQLEIVERTATNQKKNYEAILAMKEVGLQTEVAVNQAQGAYYAVLTSAKDIETQISLVENNIALLINETPQRIKLTVFEDLAALGIEVKKEIPLVALSNRPDVKMAEYSLSNSFYGVNVAHSAFYPAISIGGSVGWTNNVGAIINPATFLFSAIASLTQPLFNKGANMANLKIAKAEYEKSLLHFEKTLLSAGNEVNGILTEYFNSINKVELRNKQVLAGKSAYDNSKLLMQNSSMTYIEVLVAENMYLNAQLSQAADWLEQQQASINLYRALGGK